MFISFEDPLGDYNLKQGLETTDTEVFSVFVTLISKTKVFILAPGDPPGQGSGPSFKALVCLLLLYACPSLMELLLRLLQ